MINNKKILSVITARAGSKGVKGKNYRRLLGKPLFTWSVDASCNSEYIDKTVVSSNCFNVLDYFNQYYKNMDNVKYLQRPNEISGDRSKNEDALIHAYYHYRDVEDFDADIIINLQPTSPCRTDNLLDKCIKSYENNKSDSLLTATKDTPFLWRKEKDKWVYKVDKNHCCDRKMRQDFSEDEFVYHDNGNVYITEIKVLLAIKCRIGQNLCVYETDKINSLQIDTEFDFDLIENIVKSYKLKSLI